MMQKVNQPRIAIVGSGVSGASAAKALARSGASAVLFDKGRGPGGRSATRRHDDYSFDHGAQYFTAKDPRFRQQVAEWVLSASAARWSPRMGELSNHGYVPMRRKKMWVGTPGMNDMARDLLTGLDVRYKTRIESIQRRGNQWSLVDAEGHQYPRFDQVLVTVPAPQLPDLLDHHFLEASAAAEQANMLPCWSLMLAFDHQIELPFDAAKVMRDGPISWLARNSSKTGRANGAKDCWVVQADHQWSHQHIELTPEDATQLLLEDFHQICRDHANCISKPIHAVAHRWRYALATPDQTVPCMIKPKVGLAVAGDWLSGGRIENAWLSGLAAANALAEAWQFGATAKIAGALSQ